MTSLSIVIVNWNTRDLLAQCLRTVYATVKRDDFEVIVVDNASTDGSAEMLRERFPQAYLISNADNVGFARANNQAARESTGRYLAFLNSDTLVLPSALDTAVAYMDQHGDVGIIAPRLLNPDGSLQASCAHFPNLWREFMILSGLGRRWVDPDYPFHATPKGDETVEIDYARGACLIGRRQAVEPVGFFDEGYFMYSEEIDLCLAVKRNGWRLIYLPAAQIIHYKGKSSQQARQEMLVQFYRSQVRFFYKHQGSTRAWALRQLIRITLGTKVAYLALCRALSRASETQRRTLGNLRYVLSQL